MVQVVKDPLGTKGARLTTDITLPSRYLVFMPGPRTLAYPNVSKAKRNANV
jgi:ribonuclease G